MLKCIICGREYDFVERWFRSAIGKGEAQTCSDDCYVTFARLPEDEQNNILTQQLHRLSKLLGKEE